MGIANGGVEQPERKLVLRPVVGLTSGLSSHDLEHITINAIKKHRRSRDIAENMEQGFMAPPSTGGNPETVGPIRLAYVEAMIDMHAQQAVVSTLLDMLGYIPKVPDN